MNLLFTRDKAFHRDLNDTSWVLEFTAVCEKTYSTAPF